MSNICPVCGLKTLNVAVDKATVDTSNIVEYVAKSAQTNQNVHVAIQNLINKVQDAPTKAELIKISSDVIHLSSKLTKVEISLSQIINNYEQKVTKNAEIIKSAQSKINKYRNLAQQRENDHFDANDQNKQLIAMIERMKVEQAAKDEKCNRMKDKLRKYKNKIEESKEGMETEILQPIDDLNHQISKLKIKLSNINAENERIISENKQLSAQLSARVNEIQLQNDQIENLKKNIKETNKIVFSDVSFEVKNPYTGDLEEKFQRIISMNHFEFPQRIQMIINESARKVNALEATIIELRTQVCDQKEKLNGYDKALNETKNVLNVHLTQLRKLEANEKIFDMKKLDVDKDLLTFISKNITNDNSFGDINKLIANLTNKDDVSCSLVSSLLLANMKQQEQMQRLVDQVEQRELILQQIRDIGIPPEKAAKTITKLQNELVDSAAMIDDQHKKIESLDKEIEKQSENIEKLENEKAKITENLFNAENTLSDVKEQNNTLQRELTDAIMKSNAMQNQVEILQGENKNYKTEVECHKNTIANLTNETDDLKAALVQKKKEFADLDVRMRNARETVKAKVEDHQQRLKDLEEDHCFKMTQLQNKYKEELDAAVCQAQTIKECSYKALDASYNQTSNLKNALKEATMKYEQCRYDLEDIQRENDCLKSQNSKLMQKVTDLKARVAVLSDNVKQNNIRGNLNDQTAKHFADTACRASALKERQRIMNYVAREIGQPYKVDYFEPDDESEFHSFVRKVKEDLKKLRVFQSAKGDDM